jgi:hypothetical protein
MDFILAKQSQIDTPQRDEKQPGQKACGKRLRNAFVTPAVTEP